MESQVSNYLICADCGSYKRLANRSYCRSCHNKQNAAWKLANSTKVRGQHLTKFWPGLTPTECTNKYMELLAKQNSKCKICGKMETLKHFKSGKLKQLAVDHCHKTGKVRGLLCDKCNRGIGLLGDNTSTLFSAIQYIEGNQ